MSYPNPPNIDITVTPCTGPSTADTSFPSPGGTGILDHRSYNATQPHPRSDESLPSTISQLPSSAVGDKTEVDEETFNPVHLDDRDVSDDEANNIDFSTNGNITRTYDLDQGGADPKSIPRAIPHRQIRHADPSPTFGKNYKSREKIQQYKASRVHPDRQGPHSQHHQYYQKHQQQNGQVDVERRDDESYRSCGSRGTMGGHNFSHEAPPPVEGQLGAEGGPGGQLEMYRTRSYLSRLSYERGFDEYEKQGSGYYGDGSTFRPDPEYEKKVVKKLDKNLLPLLGILYLFSYLDRVNIGNARLFGLEDDVKLSDGQYNIALAAFFLSYCIFEMPSNMVLVRVGPRVWIPTLMLVWGGISLALAWVTSFTGLVVARFALGAAEAGFVPGVLFYLTLFYKRSEHSFRMAIFLCFNILAGATGGLLAAGISHLTGKLGLQGWQWIFILEAIPTMLLAGVTWFVMSPSPDKAKFLTAEERVYAANRILMDTDIRPTPEASWKQTKSALMDSKIYLLCLCYFFLSSAHSGVVMFLPTLILDMGFKA
ncbi:hypothetical protein BGZ98_004735 [Dissophora globulifera]|nr:hypothetical protein BGZ98_004735 [Dissophora globulifera]